MTRVQFLAPGLITLAKGLIARGRKGSLCKSAAMANGRCRMHGGMSPGAPKGNKNAYKHGRYTPEATARRRELAALLRAMKTLTEEQK
jgi:hypothetical protein